MNKVPLTTFIDFASKASHAKFTVVEEFNGEYDVRADLYKPLREAIVKLHRDNETIASLQRVVEDQTDKNKQKHYPPVIEGYRKWRGRKKLEWFAPIPKTWSCDGLQVNVNPELGLKINGSPHLIKLYFKSDAIPRESAKLITHLMSTKLTDSAPRGCKMALLHVRQGKLFIAGEHSPELDFRLRAEVAYWLSVWNSLHRHAK